MTIVKRNYKLVVILVVVIRVSVVVPCVRGLRYFSLLRCVHVLFQIRFSESIPCHLLNDCSLALDLPLQFWLFACFNQPVACFYKESTRYIIFVPFFILINLASTNKLTRL